MKRETINTMQYNNYWVACGIVSFAAVIREFKIRRLRTTNYGWTSVVLCSQHWVESCKYRTLRLHYRQQTTREEAERETTRKDFLVFITVHKNTSQFCMRTYLQNNEQILPYLREAITSGEIGERSFGYTGFVFLAHEYLCQILKKQTEIVIAHG